MRGEGEHTMHLRAITKTKVASASSIEVILDILLQAINVVSALERLLGFDISEKVNPNS